MKSHLLACEGTNILRLSDNLKRIRFRDCSIRDGGYCKILCGKQAESFRIISVIDILIAETAESVSRLNAACGKRHQEEVACLSYSTGVRICYICKIISAVIECHNVPHMIAGACSSGHDSCCGIRAYSII